MAMQTVVRLVDYEWDNIHQFRHVLKQLALTILTNTKQIAHLDSFINDIFIIIPEEPVVKTHKIHTWIAEEAVTVPYSVSQCINNIMALTFYICNANKHASMDRQQCASYQSLDFCTFCPLHIFLCNLQLKNDIQSEDIEHIMDLIDDIDCIPNCF